MIELYQKNYLKTAAISQLDFLTVIALDYADNIESSRQDTFVKMNEAITD